MIDVLHTMLNLGLVLVVVAMVVCIAMALWLTKRRHKSYEDYLAAKRKIEQGTRLTAQHIEPLRTWPKK